MCKKQVYSRITDRDMPVYMLLTASLDLALW